MHRSSDIFCTITSIGVLTKNREKEKINLQWDTSITNYKRKSICLTLLLIMHCCIKAFPLNDGAVAIGTGWINEKTFGEEYSSYCYKTVIMQAKMSKSQNASVDEACICDVETHKNLRNTIVGIE